MDKRAREKEEKEAGSAFLAGMLRTLARTRPLILTRMNAITGTLSPTLDILEIMSDRKNHHEQHHIKHKLKTRPSIFNIIALEYRLGGVRLVGENIILPFISASALGTVLFASYEIAFDELKTTRGLGILSGSLLAGAGAGALNGVCSTIFSTIEDVSRRRIEPKKAGRRVFSSAPSVSLNHALQMAGMFSAYELCRESILQQIGSIPGVNLEEVVSPFTAAGFVSIAGGGAAAAVAQHTISHVQGVVAEHTGSWKKTLTRMLPSAVRCVAVMPAQIIGFLAFEYSKALILGNEDES